ncbi:hypothetical protein [Streptomyces sp. NBC_01006]|uniref:acyl-CoA-like ligand-binding transcription factor n=1 Tax=Streptomyces sp. NBC_01006 TaxID=2903716 RepID=UPI00386CBB55
MPVRERAATASTSSEHPGSGGRSWTSRRRRGRRRAARTGRPADSLEVRLLAGSVLDAFTAAVDWAGQDEPEDLLVLTRRALTFLRLDELWRGPLGPPPCSTAPALPP